MWLYCWYQQGALLCLAVWGLNRNSRRQPGSVVGFGAFMGCIVTGLSGHFSDFGGLKRQKQQIGLFHSDTAEPTRKLLPNCGAVIAVNGR